MKTILLAASLLLALSSAAKAGTATDDANAGLNALQTGANDQAISLFTHALDSGLKGDDREFAYASRGKAYLNKGDYSSAIVDLDKARQMKPDDADAQADLATAISRTLPAAALPGQSARSIFRQLGHSLGQAVQQGVAEGLAQSAQGNQ